MNNRLCVLQSILFLVNREAQKLKSVKRSSHFEKIVNRAKTPLCGVNAVLNDFKFLKYSRKKFCCVSVSMF